MRNILSLPEVCFSLRALLKDIKPDIVQTWMYHADFIGGIVAKSLKIKKLYGDSHYRCISGGLN